MKFVIQGHIKEVGNLPTRCGTTEGFIVEINGQSVLFETHKDEVKKAAKHLFQMVTITVETTEEPWA